ncbi:MAG: HEAT repeat domain-containing protein [Desulfovibrionaceae bacterium]|nr:HEAT repeat domain-containing protein [Desulfovibrionaceae bacterium]MBF0513180.1 HEAT repeat domain-containing protein [Desulfovibrionaceae bacterium]
MARAHDLKPRVNALLAGADPAAACLELAALDPSKLAGALFSALLHRDPLIGWRAVTAFGVAAAHLAEKDMDRARVLLRRMMWSLNEESGAVGWGAPQAMGEIMARVAELAPQFHRILASYIHEGEKEGNFLEHAPLRQGVYWGLARLALTQPCLAAAAAADLTKALGDPDPAARGLAALALGRIGAHEALPALAELAGDRAEFDFFDGWEIIPARVGELAAQAALRLGELAQ